MFISPIRDLTREQSTYQFIHTKDPQTGTLEILDESHSTSCANFDLEILNFQNLICPFGLKHGVYAAGNLKDFTLNGAIDTPILEQVRKTEYQYKFNGKEWQDELGLNWTSMDFRNYDPALGRFHVMDPLSDLAPMHNPYRFGFNNPVYWSDPTGLYEYDKDGTVRSRGVQDGEIEFIQNYITENGVDGLEMALQDAGFGIDLAEATITKKAKRDFTFSNSCIVGCHNSGGKYDFDSSNFSILRKTESETFYEGGWGAGGGFTHNNKFYRPGVDKLEENDLLEWLSMLRGEFGSASSMSLQAYSDIFTLVQMWQVNGSTRSPIEVLGSTNISAQDEIIKFEFRQVIPTEKSRWNLGFAEGLQIIKTNKKDSAKTVQEAIRINDSIIQSQMSK